jgi:hypothetical protein
VEVAGDIVAVTRMTTGNKDAVSALLKGLEDKDRIDATGAGEL